MATYAATYIPGAAQAFTVTVGAGSSASTPASGANYLGFNRIVAVQPNANVTIAFFNQASTTPATATANSWPVLANSISEWDTGSNYDQISFFNAGGSSATVYVLPLSRI